MVMWSMNLKSYTHRPHISSSPRHATLPQLTIILVIVKGYEDDTVSSTVVAILRIFFGKDFGKSKRMPETCSNIRRHQPSLATLKMKQVKIREGLLFLSRLKISNRLCHCPWLLAVSGLVPDKAYLEFSFMVIYQNSSKASLNNW